MREVVELVSCKAWGSTGCPNGVCWSLVIIYYDIDETARAPIRNFDRL